MLHSRHIALVAAAAAVLLLSSCSRREKIIPRSTMASIYADMLISDEWLRNHHEEFRRADTMQVYEPIFEKYGYNTDAFRASASHYMRDPERFARILQKAASKIESRHHDLMESMRSREAIESEILNLKSYAPSVIILYDTLFFDYAFSNPIKIVQDSRGAYVPDYSAPALSTPAAAPVPGVKKIDLQEVLPVAEEEEAEKATFFEGRIHPRPANAHLEF